MKKLSDKQQLVYDHIKQYVKQNGYPPTVREVAEELGCKSASTAQFHMQKLEEMGYIIRDPAKPRAYELKELNNKTVDIPVLGTVAAGSPLYAEQNIREYFPIPAEMAKGNDYFMLKVKGDSMIKVAIYNGDLILVSRQPYVDNGEIAVVLVNNEATVKRFFKEDGYYRLQPENDLMPPIIVYNAEILGKVVGTFRFM
jgi:repressor LexA